MHLHFAAEYGRDYCAAEGIAASIDAGSTLAEILPRNLRVSENLLLLACGLLSYTGRR